MRVKILPLFSRQFGLLILLLYVYDLNISRHREEISAALIVPKILPSLGLQFVLLFLFPTQEGNSRGVYSIQNLASLKLVDCSYGKHLAFIYNLTISQHKEIICMVIVPKIFLPLNCMFVLPILTCSHHLSFVNDLSI